MGNDMAEQIADERTGGAKRMATPIADFVRQYADNEGTRFHMPGHKGKSFLGCEKYDITEIAGADSLYEADGVIAESEKNATELFGTVRTLFSTEGSSQCIRAMLYLAVSNRRTAGKPCCEEGDKSTEISYARSTAFCGKPLVVAARNVHKSFLYAAALLDMDVIWLWPEGGMDSLCSCTVTPQILEDTLKNLTEQEKRRLVAVYVTCPDYLGGMLDIKELAKVCHCHDTILAVDNAHGAYLHFLENPMHPMDLGADLCCDSAHKTLPVLTGGAYLHINKTAPTAFRKYAKEAMALFGSTSPSYLTMISLDLCNQYLADGYKERLAETIRNINALRGRLEQVGWKLEGQEPLKVTICVPAGISGKQMADQLRQDNIECEYADPQYIVLMMTPENTQKDIECLEQSLERIRKEIQEELQREVKGEPQEIISVRDLLNSSVQEKMAPIKCQQKLSIREAIFAEHEMIPVEEAEGRICGAPAVSCPPAIPIVVSGELIEKKILQIFEYYGISSLDVVV